jgi:hypothetical protein
MKFSAETIEQLAHNFQKQSYQNNSSLEHETKLSDVTFAETWIVQDTKNDKSNALGKSYPVGTWVAMSKVSDEIYAKAKAGEIKGFSIDALLQLTEVKMNINKLNITMNKDDLKSFGDELLTGIKALFNAEVKPEVIEEVKLAEDTMPEAPAEDVAEDVPVTDVEELKAAIMEMLALFSKDVDKKIENVKTEFSAVKETLETENAELKVELSKETEVEPIKPKGESKVEFKDMSNVEKMRYQRENR